MSARAGAGGKRRGRRGPGGRSSPAPRRPPQKPRYLRRGGGGSGGSGASAGAGGPRRGYNQRAEPGDSEYHYGSDFGDESGDASEPDERALSSSESEWSGAGDADLPESDVEMPPPCSDAEATPPPPGPEPIWLGDNEDVPLLVLPESSDDLLVPHNVVMRAVAVYEILRHFRHLVRLSPFRLEELCAALSCDEQSALLSEIHIALLRALLREEDSQQTHFGPIDHKDSINIALFALDNMTWPEVLRIYVESDKSFDREVLKILESCEYPFTGEGERLKILEFLCNQFLVTNAVREDLTSEVSIHYDDHCRSCHRLGDLLCCETCPAVFHLECVDPPLVKVPSEDWQCSLCKSHRVQGVTDCVSDTEKQGLLSRLEHLGFDRHGRKYWFICRRIFIEADDSTVWYYSTIPQFEELLYALDSKYMESTLYKELMECKTEIYRQMDITEKITNQLKGIRRSYLEVVNANILEIRKERIQKNKQIAESSLKSVGSKVDNESAVKKEMDINHSKMLDNENNSIVSQIDGSESFPVANNMEIEESMTDEKLTDKQTEERITRLKVNQISSGTLLFKLGNEINFRNYVNQYTINLLALNKPQRNEERDKKRHLAHKFSLTSTQEFKWVGLLNASRSLLVNTLRQTLLQLESNISSVFMHPNWSILRKPWLQAVNASNTPRDFARAMVVLQACIKYVVYVPVWHEQLGHVRLQRITASEREERKKIEKREKKEKEEEEEKNRLSFLIRYTVPVKHQIWKQKGEEYRSHGQWGWLWHSSTRKFRHTQHSKQNLLTGPQKYMVQIDSNNINKLILVDEKTHKYLNNKEMEGMEITHEMPEDLKLLKVILQPQQFFELDIEKALELKSRIFYPKIARKSRLDDMLSKRINLKILEERKFDQKVFIQKKEEVKEEEDVDIENCDNETESVVSVNNDPTNVSISNKEDLISITKDIQTLRQRYTELVQFAKNSKCYVKNCNANNVTLSSDSTVVLNCYSPLCIRKANVRKDLFSLLNKVRTIKMNSISGSGQSNSETSSLSQPSVTSNSKEYITAVVKDLVSAVNSAYKYDGKFIESYAHIRKDIKFETNTEYKTESNNDSTLCLENAHVKSEQILEESVIPAIGNEMELDPCVSGENDCEYLDVESTGKVDKFDVEKKIKKERKYRDVSIISNDEDQNYDSDRPPIPKLRISTRSRPIKSQNHEGYKTAYKPTYMAPFNRRFGPIRNSVKKEEKVLKKEIAPDGSNRVYTTTSTAGKIYMKKIIPALDHKKKRIPVKYPLCSTFHTKSKAKSILILPAHEIRKLARCGGRVQVNGFGHTCKPNSCVWPYPCSRPLFKTCWLYRTINLTSLSTVALQIRILWACIRWDDLATKPSNNDGKNQITTETEIISLEMLKHRHTGQFLDKTQYLRRKVIIPLEVPKTVREVTSIRIGLRKRKRAESPQSTEPQVTEEWVDEDKLELWEIKQYGEKIERGVPITRTSTGKLPPSRILQDTKEEIATNSGTSKVSAQEIKDKMEQQLRMQRAAHQQKRALELSQGMVTPTGNKTIISTRRVFMTKNADGTTRVIHPTAVTKTQASSSTTERSLIKSQTGQPPRDGPQKVQIIRGPDGKITVRGLIAGQQLIQTPDGKLNVTTVNQSGSLPPGSQIIATGGSVIAPTPKIAITPQIKPHSKPAVTSTPISSKSSNGNIVTPVSANKVILKPQIAAKPLDVSSSNDKQTPQGTRFVTQSGQQIIVQGNQQILVQSPQHVLVQTQPRLSQPSLVQSNGKALQTVVVQGTSPQLVQSQVSSNQQIVQGQQIIQARFPAQPQLLTTAGQSQILNRVVTPTQQIVVNNPSLAQQMASGKLQLATINGQQVLVRPIANNQVVIVAHLTSSNAVSNSNSQNVVTNVNNTTLNSVQNLNTQQSIINSQTPQSMPSLQQIQDSTNKQASPVQAQSPQNNQQAVSLTEEQLMEQRLLAGQPPGTVIKTVTAQVVHLEGGPRIVLQGLQGNSLSQQQLQFVQQQVKQQLLKAQETTGKQGVLGPTKLYLAVQPSPSSNPVIQNSSQASTPQNSQISQESQNKTISALLQSKKSVSTSVLINGQDPSESSVHAMVKPSSEGQLYKQSVKQEIINESADFENSADPNKFILTPDYIQQTIKNALKQENLNPEIEEKLLQLQKYQERQMKPEGSDNGYNSISINNIRSSNSSPGPTSSSMRKRPNSSSRNTDDEEWVESTPRKRNRPSASNQERIEFYDDSKNISRSRPSRSIVRQEPSISTQSTYINDPPSPSDERRRNAQHSKLYLLLFRQKELLKKDIIRKRGLLEKELGIEIQKELSAELALLTKAERSKQEEVKSNYRHRSHQSTSSNSNKQPVTPTFSSSSSSKSKQRKKEKLLCVCQTPYDDTKFYVGCEHCSNWFHGDCVGITEEMSKTISEFVCDECKHARDTQALYCLCRQPYDNSQFYICCDRCQDWFHGRCVGILQSEADNIDEYICPNCQKNNSVNYANMKELTNTDFENLKRLLKQIRAHKSAWPFMEPVDSKEAPMYYKIIKEPMDLKIIDKKINDESYNMLSEFIGDMTKIFDNCRYFNPKESQFYRCADSLESFFVQKIKSFREMMSESSHS